jgi:hypothetical protein
MIGMFNIECLPTGHTTSFQCEQYLAEMLIKEIANYIHKHNQKFIEFSMCYQLHISHLADTVIQGDLQEQLG